jgi:very-short-patch-repair endonuclease
MAESALERMFAYHLRAAKAPAPEKEFRFHAERRWRFDFAWPSERLAVEVEGGTWTNGRHSRGKGYEADAEKYNEATLQGWRVLRFTGRMVASGEALQTTMRALGLN